MYAVPVVLAPLSGRLHVLLVQRGRGAVRRDVGAPGRLHEPERTPRGDRAAEAHREDRGRRRVPRAARDVRATRERDPRGWIPTVAYLALIDAAVLRADESSARWEPVDALPPLGFDHARIVVDAVERLRGKLWWSNIAVGLLPERFTMPQARRVFEAISGVTLRAVELPPRARAVGSRARDRHARQGRPGTACCDVRIRGTAARRGACAGRARRRCCGAEPDRTRRRSHSNARRIVHDCRAIGRHLRAPASRRRRDDRPPAQPRRADPQGRRALPAHSAPAHRAAQEREAGRRSTTNESASTARSP